MNKLKVSIFSFLMLLSFGSSAQTSVTMAGGLAAMLVNPSYLYTDGVPLGLGGQFKVDWRAKRNGFRFIEIGIDKFKFIDKSTEKNFSLSYTRFNFGFRNYPGGDYGLYSEVGFGMQFMSTDVASSKSDEFRPMAGISPGFGYAGRIVCAGLQLHVALSPSAGIVFNPAIHLGFHLMKK